MEPYIDYSIPSITKMDLNTVDSIQLLGVKGVGPVFAHRIINYRNVLGGFVFQVPSEISAWAFQHFRISRRWKCLHDPTTFRADE